MKRPNTKPRTIGPYHLLGRIAEGGMAEVWKGCARGPAGFEKIVVIKKMLPGLMSKPAMADLFVREAKIAAHLSHPNLVQVFDFGEDEGRYYIVMEYVHGKDLAAVMSSRAGRDLSVFPMPLRLWIIAEACRGLDYVHRRRSQDGKPMNIVHRDISPQNILLSFEGAVKIADFGVSRADGEGLGERETSTVLRGKYPYMSPEQVRAEHLDRRSDVFSMGIVLWELLTGRRLFRGRSPQETLTKVREANIPEFDFEGLGLPASLQGVFEGCLARERGDRYSTARELGAAIGEVLLTMAPDVAEHVLRQAMLSLFPQDHRENPNKFWVDLLVRAEGDANPPVRDFALTDTSSDASHKDVTEVLSKPAPTATVECPAVILCFASAASAVEEIAPEELAQMGAQPIRIHGAAGLLFLPTGVESLRLHQAVQTAMALRRQHRIAPSVEHEVGPTIGVLSGFVVEDPASREGWRLTGTTESELKTLLRAAAPGTLVVPASEAERLAATFSFLQQGTQSVASEVTGFVARSRREAERLRGRGPLMGRKAELRQLLDAAGKATGDPSSRATLLVGEEGVGKSRLLAELEGKASRSGFQLVVARADRPTRFGAYGLLLDLFADLLGIDSRDDGEALRKKVSRLRLLGLGARLRGVIADALGALDASSPDGLASSPAGRPFGIDLLVGARKALQTLARDQPVLLVLEDIHRADLATRSLLPHLLRGLARSPVSAVMSSAPGDSFDRSWVEVVRLAPLAPRDGARMCAHLLKLEEWDDRFEANVVRWAAGRPRWIALMADCFVQQSGDSRQQPVELSGDPPNHIGIRQLAMLRLFRLGVNERLLVHVASVLRQPIEPELLRQVAGLEQDEGETAFRHLFAEGWFEVAPDAMVPSDLLEADLVAEGAWGGGYPGFSLPTRLVIPVELLRREVVASLGPSVRERIHGAVAAVLERKGEQSAQGLGELAYHTALGSDRRRAVDYLLSASAAALEEGERGAAAEYSLQAANFVRDRDGDVLHASRLFLAAAEHALAVGETERAHEAFSAAVPAEHEEADAGYGLRRQMVEGALVCATAGPRAAIAHSLPGWERLRGLVVDAEELSAASAELALWFRDAQEPAQAAPVFLDAAAFLSNRTSAEARRAQLHAEAAIAFARAGLVAEAEAEVSAALAEGVRGVDLSGRHRSVAALAELQWSRGQFTSAAHRFHEASRLAADSQKSEYASWYALVGASIALVQKEGRLSVELAEQGVRALPRVTRHGLNAFGQFVKSAVAFDVDPESAYLERMRGIANDLETRGSWLLHGLTLTCLAHSGALAERDASEVSENGIAGHQGLTKLLRWVLDARRRENGVG